MAVEIKAIFEVLQARKMTSPNGVSLSGCMKDPEGRIHFAPTEMAMFIPDGREKMNVTLGAQFQVTIRGEETDIERVPADEDHGGV